MGILNRELLCVLVFLLAMVGLSESAFGMALGAAVVLTVALGSIIYLGWQSYQNIDSIQ